MSVDKAITRPTPASVPAPHHDSGTIDAVAPRETLAIKGFALDGSKWDGIYVGRFKGKTWFAPVRSTMASTTPPPPRLRKRLTPLIRKTQPYAKNFAHKAIWVEPALLAEIKYRGEVGQGQGAASVL